MKKFNIIYLLLLLLVFTEISAQKKTTNIALNKAGQQRMLCERMLKNYILIGANANQNSKKYNVELDETISLFNENFYYLTNYATKNKTKDALNKLNSLWSPFRAKIFEKPTKDQCLALVIESKQIIVTCDTITEKIQMDNNVEIARTIHLSNKLNFLVERLAKNYMLKIWGVPYENLDKETRETVNTFEYSLGILSNSSKNTAETKAILEKEYENWEKLKEYFSDFNPKINTDFVNSQTASMTKDFKTVTLIYQKIADEM